MRREAPHRRDPHPRWDIYVASEVRGESPDQIIGQYPHLSLAQVHTALAYYRDNREAIDRQMREADEYADKLKAADPSPGS